MLGVKHRVLLLPLLLSVATLAQAEGGLRWSSEPEAGMEAPAAAGGEHAGHGRRAPTLYLHGASEGVTARMVLPTLVRRPLSVTGQGQVKLPSSGLDNYHLLKAVRQSGQRLETALRYHYFNGKPSGYSPQLLLDMKHSALAITPAPLPREHWRYESDKSFDFLISFNGEPLVNQRVVLESSNGSRMEVKSGLGGRLRIQLPDDFDGVKPGRRANRPAEFTLSVEKAQQGVAHITTLSAPYHVNPSHWRSTWGGLAAMGFGFFAGLLWLRRVRREEA